jgi:hypothetical protein
VTRTAEQQFPFLQLELAGETGLDVGRYLVRMVPEGEPEAVLVVSTVGAAPKRSRFFERRQKPSEEEDDSAEPLTATRLTAVHSKRAMAPPEADAWLERLKGDPEALQDFVDEGVTVLNRAIHAQRAASMDPYLQEVSPEKASAVRAGYGSGQQVADGSWSQALRIPKGAATTRRRRRVDALRPQERMAKFLGGHEQVSPFETLLLRARLDLDQGRPREAALQLRPAIDALLGDVPEGIGGDELRDMEALDDQREAVAAAAEEATSGSLSAEGAEAVAEALKIGERILRRRRILG